MAYFNISLVWSHGIVPSNSRLADPKKMLIKEVRTHHEKMDFLILVHKGAKKQCSKKQPLGTK